MYVTSGYISTMPCRHCNQYHTGRCPQVKAIEYYPDGKVKRVEFTDPGDYGLPLGVPSQPRDPIDPPYIVTVGSTSAGSYEWNMQSGTCELKATGNTTRIGAFPSATITYAVNSH